jgi:hypothetical protein
MEEQPAMEEGAPFAGELLTPANGNLKEAPLDANKWMDGQFSGLMNQNPLFTMTYDFTHLTQMLLVMGEGLKDTKIWEKRMTEKFEEEQAFTASERKKLDEKIDREVERLDEKIDTHVAALYKKIDEVRQELIEKIDEVDERLNAKIDEVDDRLTKKIDEVDERLNTKIDTEVKRLDEKIDAGLLRLDQKFTARCEEIEAAAKKLREDFEETKAKLTEQVDNLEGAVYGPETNKCEPSITDELGNMVANGLQNFSQNNFDDLRKLEEELRKEVKTIHLKMDDGFEVQTKNPMEAEVTVMQDIVKKGERAQDKQSAKVEKWIGDLEMIDDFEVTIYDDDEDRTEYKKRLTALHRIVVQMNDETWMSDLRSTIADATMSENRLQSIMKHHDTQGFPEGAKGEDGFAAKLLSYTEYASQIKQEKGALKQLTSTKRALDQQTMQLTQDLYAKWVTYNEAPDKPPDTSAMDAMQEELDNLTEKVEKHADLLNETRDDVKNNQVEIEKLAKAIEEAGGMEVIDETARKELGEHAAELARLLAAKEELKKDLAELEVKHQALSTSVDERGQQIDKLSKQAWGAGGGGGGGKGKGGKGKGRVGGGGGGMMQGGGGGGGGGKQAPGSPVGAGPEASEAGNEEPGGEAAMVDPFAVEEDYGGDDAAWGGGGKDYGGDDAAWGGGGGGFESSDFMSSEDAQKIKGQIRELDDRLERIMPQVRELCATQADLDIVKDMLNQEKTASKDHAEQVEQKFNAFWGNVETELEKVWVAHDELAGQKAQLDRIVGGMKQKFSKLLKKLTETPGFDSGGRIMKMSCIACDRPIAPSSMFAPSYFGGGLRPCNGAPTIRVAETDGPFSGSGSSSRGFGESRGMVDEYGYSPAPRKGKPSYKNTSPSMQVEYDTKGAGFKSPMQGRTSTTSRRGKVGRMMNPRKENDRIHIEEAI